LSEPFRSRDLACVPHAYKAPNFTPGLPSWRAQEVSLRCAWLPTHHHSPNRQAATEIGEGIISANVKSLIEQLEAGKSDALTAYLNAVSRFHDNSLGNILEIVRQRPDATLIVGTYEWHQLGRRIRKGEKAIRILAPIIGFVASDSECALNGVEPRFCRHS
jgi:hypothetical protein